MSFRNNIQTILDSNENHTLVIHHKHYCNYKSATKTEIYEQILPENSAVTVLKVLVWRNDSIEKLWGQRQRRNGSKKPRISGLTLKQNARLQFMLNFIIVVWKTVKQIVILNDCSKLYVKVVFVFFCKTVIQLIVLNGCSKLYWM